MAVNRIQLVEFSDDDIQESINRTEVTLIGRFFMENMPILVLQRILVKLWFPGGAGKVSVMEAEHGVLQFVFPEKADKDRVLSKTPWLIREHYLLHVQEWRPITKEVHDELAKVPFFVHFRNVPSDCRSVKLGRRLASTLGEVLHMGLYGVNSEASYFIKARVLIDVDLPLISCIPAGNSSRGAFKVVLAYEWLPRYCFNCGRIGHVKESCKAPHHNSSELYTKDLFTKPFGSELDEKTLLPLRGRSTRLAYDQMEISQAPASVQACLEQELDDQRIAMRNSKGKAIVEGTGEPDPTEAIAKKLPGIVISEPHEKRPRTWVRTPPVKPKPGFKMGIYAMDDMLVDRKRPVDEMMSEPELRKASPKRFCTDSDDLLGVEEAELSSNYLNGSLVETDKRVYRSNLNTEGSDPGDAVLLSAQSASADSDALRTAVQPTGSNSRSALAKTNPPAAGGPDQVVEGKQGRDRPAVLPQSTQPVQGCLASLIDADVKLVPIIPKFDGTGQQLNPPVAAESLSCISLDDGSNGLIDITYPHWIMGRDSYCLVVFTGVTKLTPISEGVIEGKLSIRGDNNDVAPAVKAIGQMPCMLDRGPVSIPSEGLGQGQSKHEGNNTMLPSRKVSMAQRINSGKSDAASGTVPAELNRENAKQNSTVLPAKTTMNSMSSGSGKRTEQLIINQHGSFLATENSQNLAEKIQNAVQSCWKIPNQQEPHDSRTLLGLTNERCHA